VDLLAVASLVGTLAVQAYLAGSLIAVMVATGRALEAAAEHRASRDLQALLEHAPRSARRRVGKSVTTVLLEAAGIVRLAEQAGAESAPVVRLADRYAAWFLPLALLVAAVEWPVSGSAVRAVAVLAEGPNAEALDALRRAHEYLTTRLLPHGRAEEAQLSPALATPLGGPEATDPMSRAHAEIERLSCRLGTHLEVADPAGGLGADQVEDVLATL
jgi:hypothetical protein